MKKILSILMVMALLAGFGIVVAQANTSITEAQLVGRWRVTASQNQVFRPNDVLVFNAGGSGQVIRANGATSGMTYQFVMSGNARLLRLTSAAIPGNTMSFGQVVRSGNNLTIGTTTLTLVPATTPTPPTPPAGGNTIPGTDRPATTWNWFLFVFAFGWIWM